MAKEDRTAGQTGSSFLAEVRAALPALPAAQAAVARAALADPAAVSQLSITELASLSGASPATVTRFCRDLGLASYAQLRLRLAASAELLKGDGGGLTGDIARGDLLADVVRKVARSDAHTVEDTVDQLDVTVLATVVDRVARARDVEIFGAGTSGAVGTYIQSKLRSLGIPAVAFTDTDNALMSVAQAGPKHVVLAISHTGATVDAYRVIREAGRHGACTVAITSNPRSALAMLADFVLPTVGSEATFRTGVLRSRTADMVVADCLCVGLALRRYDASVAALGRVERALEDRYDGG